MHIYRITIIHCPAIPNVHINIPAPLSSEVAVEGFNNESSSVFSFKSVCSCVGLTSDGSGFSKSSALTFYRNKYNFLEFWLHTGRRYVYFWVSPGVKSYTALHRLLNTFSFTDSNCSVHIRIWLFNRPLLWTGTFQLGVIILETSESESWRRFNDRISHGIQ